MKLPTLKLYGRLLVWFVAANVVTLFVSVFVTERFAREAYRGEPDWAALAASANQAWLEGGAAALNDWRRQRHRDGIDATLFEARRNLLDGDPPPMARRLLDRLESEDSIVLRPRRGVLLAAEAVTGADGVQRHLLAFRGPRPPHARIEHLLLVQVVLSCLVIGALGWWVARSIARPVAAIGDATRRMTAGDLAARVGARWSERDDELGRLAADFDRMAARLEALIAHERGVLQDVSHELRSPLARLHLLLDLARRTPPDAAEAHFVRAEGEIGRLDRIIGEALALSRMEADLPGAAVEPVALAVLVEGRVAACRVEAEARGITLGLRAEPGPSVDGSAGLIERAIDNLLSNAIKFSDDGGRVEVTVVRDGDAVRIAVRDHGPGVPEADLPNLTRPFFRGGNAALADGHGLGLAIVDRIVRAHRGSLALANAEGGGLRVMVRLPMRREAGLE
jgi:two-component system OmpR family sensor kinase